MALQCVSREKCRLKGGAVHCEVDGLVGALSIPDSVGSEARRICSTVVEGRIVKRQPLELIAASSIYAACRESRTPITIKELAAQSGSKPVEIGRCYKLMISKMGIAPPVPNGTRYVDRVAEATKVSEEARRLAKELERKAMDAGLSDGSPMVVAAAAVDVACLMTGEVKTQWEVAEAAGVGVVSVREAAKEIRRLLGVAVAGEA